MCSCVFIVVRLLHYNSRATCVKLNAFQILRTKHRPRDGHLYISPFHFLSEQLATRRLHAVAKVVAFLVVLGVFLAVGNLCCGRFQYGYSLAPLPTSSTSKYKIFILSCLAVQQITRRQKTNTEPKIHCKAKAVPAT